MRKCIAVIRAVSARQKPQVVSCVANKVYGESLSNLTLDRGSPRTTSLYPDAVHCKISMGSLKAHKNRTPRSSTIHAASRAATHAATHAALPEDIR